MSDNFGPNQDRVLDVIGRNLDNVVFQERIAPLTSENNLVNQVGNLKAQEAVQSVYPSGWLTIDDIEEIPAVSPSDFAAQTNSENSARTGQVLTSITYLANTLKLMTNDLYNNSSNIAIVNGWPIVVQGAGFSPDSNNTIELPVPLSTYRYDIVFLEVWRKLVSGTDSVYLYGCVQNTPYSDNQIIWDVPGFETTKRVQIQYRIRTFSSNFFGQYPDGLGDPTIYPIGGRIDGSVYSYYSFENSGPKDAGLYIAGDGSTTAQTALNTVDGYVYAIPMFVVYRRAQVSFDPSHLHGSEVTRDMYALGYRSDRPDGRFVDIINKEDIVDLRHQVVTSSKQLSDITKKSFRKLVSGNLTTSLNKDSTGAAGSGGAIQTKIEQTIVSGSTTLGFKRRSFANSGLSLLDNIIEVPQSGAIWSGGAWVAGSVAVSTFFTPAIDPLIGTIDYTTNFGLYTSGGPDLSYGTDYTIAGSTLTIPSGSALVTSLFSGSLYFQFKFDFYPSDSGFKDIPKKILEVDKIQYAPIATRDSNVSLRFSNEASPKLLEFDSITGKSINNLADTTTDYRDCVRYAGGQYAEPYDFGHELIIHRTADGPSMSISSINGKYCNYVILGVKTVKKETSPNVFGDPLNFNISKSISGIEYIYTIDVVGATINLGDTLQIILYTGSGDISTPSTQSFKFFEFNKQGRGIIDTYEMVEVTATYDGGVGGYVIDTVDKPILAVATQTYDSPVATIPYALFSADGIYYTNSAVNLLDSSLPPVLSYNDYTSYNLPTYIVVTCAVPLLYIKIALLVHSYVLSGEGTYNFIYQFNPYQGLLASPSKLYGKFESEGPALITTEGSGAVHNFSYSEGVVTVSQGSRTVTGLGTAWDTSTIKSGDYLQVTGAEFSYRIISVDSTSQITLSGPFRDSSVISGNYTIYRLDMPLFGISNIIDRMPTYLVEDYVGTGTPLSISGITGVQATMYETCPKVKIQDPLETITNDFGCTGIQYVGRGISNFALTLGKNDVYKLGNLTPYLIYETQPGWSSSNTKKVYQAYVFNKSTDTTDHQLTGKLYLIIMSSESSNNTASTLLSAFTANDTVDIFELIGKPIVRV